MTWLDLAHLYVHIASLAIAPALGIVVYAIACIGVHR
jgi:hypothetical protein